MTESVESLLQSNGYDVHGRTKGASGACWVVGSKRTTWDYGDKEARLFVAVSDERKHHRELHYKFSVSRSALASERVKRLTGNTERFLLEAGLLRFRRLLSADDGVEKGYPEEMLHTRSGDEEFVMESAGDLDYEISRVQTTILEVLRNNAYRAQKRTSKADIAHAACTSDAILDQTLRLLEHRQLITGALGGQMKITPDGEVELANRRANVASASGGSAVEPRAATGQTTTYDVFISHASEDKDGFVRPLAAALVQAGLNVWYDEFTLKLGDSLRASIDKGLTTSRFGVVILSHRFFSKEWPQKELNGLFALMQPGEKKLLPIWHEITREELARYSPMVVDLLAARSSDGIEAVVQQILDVVRG